MVGSRSAANDDDKTSLRIIQIERTLVKLCKKTHGKLQTQSMEHSEFECTNALANVHFPTIGRNQTNKKQNGMCVYKSSWHEQLGEFLHLVQDLNAADYVLTMDAACASPYKLTQKKKWRGKSKR